MRTIPVIDTLEVSSETESEKERFLKQQREIEKVAQKLVEKGEITSFDVFYHDSFDVINGVANHHFLRNMHGEQINIAEKMRDKGYIPFGTELTHIAVWNGMYFRKMYNEILDIGFEEGYKLGHQDGRKIGKPFDKEKIKKGEAVRIKNADDHAKKMFEIFQNSKEISEAKSIRSIVRILNEQKTETARGGQWGVETVRGLYSRWEKLGLRSEPNPE